LSVFPLPFTFTITICATLGGLFHPYHLQVAYFPLILTRAILACIIFCPPFSFRPETIIVAMRLLHFDKFGRLTWSVFSSDIPPYAILSHTWDVDEFNFENLVNRTGESKAGYRKILFCGEQAARDHLQYFWVDTCCIDKWNPDELSNAINSMFRWYQNAAKCYVFLSDVPISTVVNEWEVSFRKSRWFTRGWTLQELIAPASVEFFSSQLQRLGDKQSLEQQIHEITAIPIKALHGHPLGNFSVVERMAWAKSRQTTQAEDGAYCLLGIFGISMLLDYGEGKENALNRLQKEVNESFKKGTTYTSLFDKY